MRIATRLTVNALLPLLIASVVGFGIGVAVWETEAALERQARVERLSEGVLDLGLLAYSYMHLPHPRKWQQWAIQYQAVQDELATIRRGLPRQRALLDSMGDSLANMAELFSAIVARGVDGDAAMSDELERMLVGRLGIGIRDLTGETARLEAAIAADLTATLRRTGLGVLGVTVAAALLGFATLWMLNSSIMRSIRRLHRGAEAVGAGHLEHHVGLRDGDELGRLGAAFDHMIERLRATTVSRDSLAAEVEVRKRVEQALRDSETRERRRAGELETVLMAMPAPLLISRDPDCRDIRGNQAAQRLFGMDRQDNLSASRPAEYGAVPYVVSSGGVPLAPEQLPMQRAVAEGREIAVSVLQVASANEVSFITGRAVPLRDEAGTVIGALGAFLDVTELVRSEQALQRMNVELEEFAYVASHDLKAPLRAVANLAHWIDEDAGAGLDPENRERLALLRSRIVRMDRLIDGLLAYSRTARGDAGEPLERVELGALLTELLAELALPAGFAVDLQAPLPTLWARPLHLRQVFQNLILNAVHHHDRSEGRITVRALEQGEAWRLEVADDGPGVPARFRANLFKMFATLSRDSERREGRTGIGLALVKKLVLYYGGGIAIDDNRPRGAVFRITWPKQPKLAAHG